MSFYCYTCNIVILLICIFLFLEFMTFLAFNKKSAVSCLSIMLSIFAGDILWFSTMKKTPLTKNRNDIKIEIKPKDTVNKSKKKKKIKN